MTGRPKGSKNKRQLLDDIIDTILGDAGEIPALKHERNRLRKMIKLLIWQHEGTREQK